MSMHAHREIPSRENPRITLFRHKMYRALELASARQERNRESYVELNDRIESRIFRGNYVQEERVLQGQFESIFKQFYRKFGFQLPDFTVHNAPGWQEFAEKLNDEHYQSAFDKVSDFDAIEASGDEVIIPEADYLPWKQTWFIEDDLDGYELDRELPTPYYASETDV